MHKTELKLRSYSDLTPQQEHTRGPWTIRRSNDGSGDVGITADGLPNVLAECFGAIRHRGERSVDEAMANACLIAAAPDMLAALLAIEAVCVLPPQEQDLLDLAIAKAVQS